jgi:glycosyltransferase involved in cell wall biosynthesis
VDDPLRYHKSLTPLLKVAILTPSAELGGAERSLITFLRSAQGKTIEATVFLPRFGPLSNILSRLGVHWDVIPMPRAFLQQSRQKPDHALAMLIKSGCYGPKYLLRLVKVFCQNKFDILYTYGIKSNILGALLRPLLPISLVWHLRDVSEGRLLGRLADWGPDFIIANSQASAIALQKNMRKTGKLRIIHNAVDNEEFSPEGPTISLSNIASGAYKVGLVAAFAKLKGHSLLLDAIPKIRKEFPNACFFFIGGSIYDTLGDQGYEEELRNAIKEKNSEDCVVFAGFQMEMAPWYRAMDIVVSASLVPESFGRTLLEGMACGKPVVGPNAGGIPEFVRHGENGLLYELGNADELAESVITLLRNPVARRCLGKAGRETALLHFSSGPHAGTISQVLSKVAMK